MAPLLSTEAVRDAIEDIAKRGGNSNAEGFSGIYRPLPTPIDAKLKICAEPLNG
jgi:hypothetical protein